MKANLDEIAQFVTGKWFADNGRIVYEFEPADEDYLGNTSITSLPQNNITSTTYLLSADNNRIYIIIGETEYVIEELDRDRFIYHKDRKTEVLLRRA